MGPRRSSGLLSSHSDIHPLYVQHDDAQPAGFIVKVGDLVSYHGADATVDGTNNEGIIIRVTHNNVRAFWASITGTWA